MGNTSSKVPAGEGAGKHGSADSRTPLFLSVPSSKYQEDAEKDSVHGALRQLSVRSGNEQQDAIAPVSPAAPVPTTPVIIDEMEGHSNISRPPSQVRQILRLSEILDIDNLPASGHVRSPSGNLLDHAQYIAHPDRPLTLRERQERILRRVRELEQTGDLAKGATEEVSEAIDKKSAAKETPTETPTEKTKPLKRRRFCCF